MIPVNTSEMTRGCLILLKGTFKSCAIVKMTINWKKNIVYGDPDEYCKGFIPAMIPLVLPAILETCRGVSSYDPICVT